MSSYVDITNHSKTSLRRQLYFYALGHILIASLITLLAFDPFSHLIGIPAFPLLARISATAYLFSSILLLFWCRYMRRIVLVISISASIDIVIAILVTHALPMASTGIAMMLLFNIAFATLLLPLQRSLIVTLLASLGLILEYYWSFLIQENPSKSLLELSTFVVSYLALAWLAYLGGRSTRKSQALAEQKSAEVANLVKVSEMVIRRMRTGVLVVDADNRVTLVNEAVSMQLTHYDPSVGPVSLNRLIPELGQRLQRWRNGIDTDDDVPLRLAPDQPEVMPRFVKPMADSDMTLIFLDDPTIVSQRAESLTLATLGRFSASLAHEIRNPLAAINYACQLLEESDNLDPPDRRLLQIIHQQCQRTNSIIENVLGIARRERAKPENVNLNTFVKRFVTEYRQTLSIETDILEASLSSQSVFATVDPGHLQQILSTLVHNAFKYGRVMDEPAHIRIRVTQNGQQSIIEVLDRGPGIPERIAAQLFRPFFTTSEHGTGLGLYIAQELCRANQACLEYIPVPGGGACFRITFTGTQISFSAASSNSASA